MMILILAQYRNTLVTCTKNICNVYKNICIHVGVGNSADLSLPASPKLRWMLRARGFMGPPWTPR